jgi:multiple sugar transport system substrate-binding protein
MDRRAALRLGALAGTALLAACGAPPAPTPTSKPAEAPAAKPAESKPAVAATKPASAGQPAPATKPATGAPAAGAKVTRIQFATDWNAGVRKETIDVSLREFAKKRPDIPVEALHLGPGTGTSSVGGFSEQVVTMFVAGTAPDLVFSWIEIVGTYRNFLAELTPLLNERKYRELGIVDVPKFTHWEGKQYGVNFAPATGGWLVNYSMFEQAGVPAPKEDWTWDEALEAFQKVTKPEEKRWGFWSRKNWEYGYVPMVMTNGGSMFTDDTNKTVNLGNPNGVEAFQWWIDLIHKHKVAPPPALASGMATAETNDLFNLGLVASTSAGFQSVGNNARFIGTRFKWGLLPYPRSPRTNDRRYLFHTEPLVVPKDAEKRGNAGPAVDLALFLAGDDVVQGFIADNRPTIPVKTSVVTGERYTKAPPENMAQIGRQLTDTQRQYQTRPLVKWFAEFTQKLSAAADKAFIGEAPADRAWDEAVKATQKVVDSAN